MSSNAPRMDLNLLLSLHVLLEEANVTRAAERMRVSQPAMSSALKKLRVLLDDDLLVRRGRSLVLTPVAERLRASAAGVMDRTAEVFSGRDEFDPSTSSATFTILSSDYVALVLLQPLMARLDAQARFLRIRMRPIDSNFGEWLRDGRADLAIVPREIASSDENLHSAAVFSDDFLYVCDKRNPIAAIHTTWRDLASQRHVGYGSESIASVGHLALDQIGGIHSQEVTTQGFVLATYLVRETDFVSLVPRRLAQLLEEPFELALFDPPTPIGEMNETAYWSSRTHDDPAHRWLRDQLRQIPTEATP